MNTIKFNKLEAKVVAHRGLSGIERENTAAAFVAAGNRSYYGIETDIWRTADGHFLCCHDGHFTRVGGEEIYVERLCEKFLLSKNALYQLFQNEFNTTVNGFITAKRIQLAQKYLSEENGLNVTQISSLCGFPDYNYFIRIFKRLTGRTPLAYRKIKTK